jgi:hypothetical protein
MDAELWLENFISRGGIGDLGLDGNVLTRWMLKKLGKELYPGFSGPG